MCMNKLVTQFLLEINDEKAKTLLYELLVLFGEYFNEQRRAFALEQDIELLEDYYDTKTEYVDYLSQVLWIARQQLINKSDGLSKEDLLIAVVLASTRLINTETQALGQLAKITVAHELETQNGNIKIMKRWVANPNCCPICRALDGMILPLDQPFLSNGQVVELEEGKSYTYGYADRLSAVAHPNDRCSIEFVVINL